MDVTLKTRIRPEAAIAVLREYQEASAGTLAPSVEVALDWMLCAWEDMEDERKRRFWKTAYKRSVARKKGILPPVEVEDLRSRAARQLKAAGGEHG